MARKLALAILILISTWSVPLAQSAVAQTAVPFAITSPEANVESEAEVGYPILTSFSGFREPAVRLLAPATSVSKSLKQVILPAGVYPFNSGDSKGD